MGVLNSKSAQEVIDLLSEINTERTAIVLVTLRKFNGINPKAKDPAEDALRLCFWQQNG